MNYVRNDAPPGVNIRQCVKNITQKIANGFTNNLDLVYWIQLQCEAERVEEDIRGRCINETLRENNLSFNLPLISYCVFLISVHVEALRNGE